MNSRKCPNCGFISSAISDKCKRCKKPFPQIQNKTVTNTKLLYGFHTEDIKHPSFFSRLFRKSSINKTENAYKEIQNLIATTYILHISQTIFDSVLERYGLTKEEAKPYFQELFSKILKHFIQDNKISDEDVLQIQHLQYLFSFSDLEVEELKKVIIIHFDIATKNALAEVDFIPHIKDRITKLAGELRINKQDAEAIYYKHAYKIYQKAIYGVLAEKYLSPEKEEMLKKLSDNLGITFSVDAETKSKLERLKSFWRYCNGDLPVIKTWRTLLDNELCAASASATRYEVNRKIQSADLIKFKIGDFRYRRRSLKLDFNSTADITYLNYGTLHFTNQRLLFKGNDKVTYVPLNKIINYWFYDDGLVVEKLEGESQIYQFKGDISFFASIMSGLMSGQAYKNHKKERHQKQSTNQDNSYKENSHSNDKKSKKQNKSSRQDDSKKHQEQKTKHSNNEKILKYYRILGINAGSTVTQIKSAYKEKMKKYHPDKVSSNDKEKQSEAERMSKDINEAYSEIMKENK